ncbi:alpha/beta hydrolase [Streptomyces sp. NPDC005917]|uniref:alpha/beta fold hydrolase n=1 Tax=unclassified Streptomyces TaxID=2593676 RepID=UPI0033CD6627
MVIGRRQFSVLGAGVAAAALSGAPVAREAARSPRPKARNVVLVHGAYADGSSWAKVIPLLQAAGLNVIAVQNPLTSLADDVAATNFALARQSGPTVLVAHSYGGTVISQTGLDADVTALVYVAARAPEAGEDFAALSKKFPAPPVNSGLITKSGFRYLSESAFLQDFANGVPRKEALTLYAVQGPLSTAPPTTTVAAWHKKPSWYVVSKNDRTINPELERFMAKRMKATTTEVDSGHLSIVTHPEAISRVILQAANS